MDQEEIEKLADAIHTRMAQAVLKLPKDFKELALGNFILPKVTIPMANTTHDYFVLDIRVTMDKLMIFRLMTMDYTILKEWVME